LQKSSDVNWGGDRNVLKKKTGQARKPKMKAFSKKLVQTTFQERWSYVHEISR